MDKGITKEGLTELINGLYSSKEVRRPYQIRIPAIYLLSLEDKDFISIVKSKKSITITASSEELSKIEERCKHLKI